MLAAFILTLSAIRPGVEAACLQQPCGGVTPPVNDEGLPNGPYTDTIAGSSKLEQWDSSIEPEDFTYRPWDKRFALRAEDASAERHFDYGYSDFDKDFPRHPEAPNSLDRNAESSVILVFVLTALGTVVGAVFAWEFLQAHSERHHHSLVLALTLPWSIASWWLMRIALRNFLQPGREGSGMKADARYNWQCDAATWYLFLAPGITLLAIASQALWLFGGTANVESQAPMGRMLPGAWPGGAKNFQGVSPTGGLAGAVAKPAVRYVILVLETAATLGGSFLAFKLVDAGQRANCEPDVWWTAVVLAATTASVLTLSLLVALCGSFGAFGDLQGSVAEVPGNSIREEGVEFQGIRDSLGVPY